MMTPDDYRTLFHASPHAYLVMDPDLIILGASNPFLRSVQRTEEEIVGRYIFDAFPEDPKNRDGTNVSAVKKSLLRVLAKREPDTTPVVRYAIQVDTPDGQKSESRYWSVVHTPVFDESGRIRFIVQNSVDVTELYELDKRTQVAPLQFSIPNQSRPEGFNQTWIHEALLRILNNERQHSRSLFDQSPGFFAVLSGPKHIYEMVNNAYYQMVGHRDLIGKPVFEALPEAVGQGFEELLDGVYTTGQPVSARAMPATLQREPNGPIEKRYIDLTYEPHKDQYGNTIGIFAQGSDVTEVYEANQRLAEKVRELEAATSRQAFQAHVADRIRPLTDPDEVVAVASDLLGRYLGVARVAYGALDDTGNSLSMKPDWTNGALSSMTGMMVQLDDFGPWLAGSLRAGESLAIADVTTDDRTATHLHAYAALGIRSFVAIPLMNEGRLRAILALHDLQTRHWTEAEIDLAQDIIGRTWSAVESARAQTELRAERDQSKYIFDSMTEGFALMDKDWTMLHVNAEGLRITQRTLQQIVGHNHWEAFPELKGTPLEECYRRVKETRCADVIEMPYTFPDGSKGWIEIRVYPALNDGLAFFFRDISERKATHEKLKDADRRKDEFLAMLAHELRNPLAPIGAAAQLLEIVNLDETQVRQTSQIIGRQVAHMTSLVDDLLDVSRVTRGLVELDAVPLDVSEVITDAIEQATPLIRAKEHHLGMHLAGDASFVLGDKKRLVQVVTNILSNAAKYSKEGGSILIRTELREAHVLIQISDEGIGMAPDLVERAFDLFTQAERTSDRSSGGLGLGLALVKSLVDLHGGTVTCASKGLGHGSTFTICLPRISVDTRAKGTRDVDFTFEQNGNALSIMVVDDNEDAAHMLAMLLEASGHQVIVEHGARRALERAKAEPPQVFLLDIGLPGMDGNELAQRLRAQPETANSILVAITGYGQDSDRGRTLASGFNYHLIKPVDMAKLAAILAEVANV